MQADGRSARVLQWHCCSARPIWSSLLTRVHLGKITGEFTYVRSSTYTQRNPNTCSWLRPLCKVLIKTPARKRFHYPFSLRTPNPFFYSLSISFESREKAAVSLLGLIADQNCFVLSNVSALIQSRAHSCSLALTWLRRTSMIWRFYGQMAPTTPEAFTRSS